jgi:hypothetical protein
LAHFSASPTHYKKLLQIRSVSDQLPSNIHEKMRQKSWFWLAAQNLQRLRLYSGSGFAAAPAPQQNF